MSSGFVAPYADGILGFSQDGSISVCSLLISSLSPPFPFPVTHTFLFFSSSLLPNSVYQHVCHPCFLCLLRMDWSRTPSACITIYFTAELYFLSPSLFCFFLVFYYLYLMQQSYLDTSGSGVLTLGGVDESIVNEQFHYTPLQQLTNHYQISLESLQVKTYPLSLSLFPSLPSPPFQILIYFQVEGESVVSSLTVLLDTGTTYILLPRSAYQKIVSHFQTHYCNLTGVCSQANIFNGNCLIDVRVCPPFPLSSCVLLSSSFILHILTK